MIKSSNGVYALATKFPGWRYDPVASEKNECRVYRLDHADHTALASRFNHKGSRGWRVQITGRRAYFYNDAEWTLQELTGNVAADIEKLVPVVVIETPADSWVVCPGCGGNAVEVGFLEGTDCPECGHIAAEGGKRN